MLSDTEGEPKVCCNQIKYDSGEKVLITIDILSSSCTCLNLTTSEIFDNFDHFEIWTISAILSFGPLGVVFEFGSCGLILSHFKNFDNFQ